VSYEVPDSVPIPSDVERPDKILAGLTARQVAIATASGEVLGVWDRQLISTDAHDSCKVVTQDWDEKAPLRAAK